MAARPGSDHGLTQLSASFRIEQGQATTTDLTLAGPLVRMTGAGTVDLPAKTLAFRVEPKLVLTTEGQGSAANPVGLGIPVAIEGPWAEPRIYPDVAGMLDNPEAAYAKLKEIGKGLFGQGGRAAAHPTSLATSSAKPWATCCSRDWVGAARPRRSPRPRRRIN